MNGMTRQLRQGAQAHGVDRQGLARRLWRLFGAIRHGAEWKDRAGIFKTREETKHGHNVQSATR